MTGTPGTKCHAHIHINRPRLTRTISSNLQHAHRDATGEHATHDHDVRRMLSTHKNTSMPAAGSDQPPPPGEDSYGGDPGGDQNLCAVKRLSTHTHTGTDTIDNVKILENLWAMGKRWRQHSCVAFRTLGTRSANTENQSLSQMLHASEHIDHVSTSAVLSHANNGKRKHNCRPTRRRGGGPLSTQPAAKPDLGGNMQKSW